MEKIKREISLEGFKNRFSKTDTSSKATIADDVVIGVMETTLLQIADNIPILTVGVETIEEEDGITRYRGNEERYYENIPSWADKIRVLRYCTMVDLLTKTEDFFDNSKIFQLCKRGNSRKMVEIDIDTFLTNNASFRFSKIAPSILNVCVNLEEDTSGNTYFVEDEDCESGSISAFEILTSEETLFNADGNYFYVVNNIDIGNYIWVNPDFEWFLSVYGIPEDMGNVRAALNRAKYFVQFAENKKHKANGFEGFIPISLFIEEESEDMGLFTSIASEFVPGRKYILGDQIIDSDGVIWTLIRGEDITEITVPPVLRNFVTKQLEGATDVYRPYDSSLFNTVLTDLEHIYVKYDVPWDKFSTPSFVKAYYDSLYFDEDVHWRKEEDSSITQYTAITESKLSSYRRADIGDDSKPLPFRLKYNTNNEDELELLSGGTYDGSVYYVTDVPFNGVQTALTETGITFTYIADNDGISGSSILIYTETYPYVEKYGFFNVTLNENDKTPSKCFKYLNIDFTKGDIEDVYDLYGNKPLVRLNATIERDGTESQDVPYFKEEELLGIQDVAMDIDNITIERGSSAAYERHSVLGEVTTMDDLVKYKNGFFKVIDDENN